jgi:N-acetylglutamate synthase and related acetyltransferases
MTHFCTEITDSARKSAICDAILRSLPDWFGIEQSIVEYVNKVRDLPFWAILDDSGEAVGFVALLPHTAHAAEVCVMGVRHSHHRSGCGRQLIEACAGWCRANGVPYLTVKTLAETHPDPGYAKTRQFYTAMGFVPLEVFPTLWDEHNPCLLMVSCTSEQEMSRCAARNLRDKKD